MWSTEDQNMTDLIKFFNTEGVDLEEENDTAGFLGVKLNKTAGGYTMMTQEVLIDRIIEAMGLDVDHNNPKSTPCMKAPLTKDMDGDPCSEYFVYASIVGMLLYLAGNSCPDIHYSLIQVARLTLCPKRSHESGLKLIDRYLFVTRNKEFIITRTYDLNIDAYLLMV